MIVEIRAGRSGRSPRRTAVRVAAGAALLVALAACTSGSSGSPTAASPSVSGTATSAEACPQALDASKADFYPIQPSFSAGYQVAGQKLNSTTANWAYVVDADFPYSQWMAWYLYDTKGVPLFKISDTEIKPDDGSTNPFVQGNPVLAPKRHYRLYFMPSTTSQSVVSSMQAKGMNVGVLPSASSTPGVSIVGRSYWTFANDGLGNYDRFGYHGPTNTPVPSITAQTTDPSTGELTGTTVSDCAAQSQLPDAIRYNPTTNSPIVTFENAPVPTTQQLSDIPNFLLQSGAVGGTGKEFPPSPIAEQVQFYRNVAANTPYADVQSAPAPGDPPDACGGYVIANLPNDVVSLVHIPKVPSFPDYRGATASTKNDGTDYEVQFYSVVVYGATKQVDDYGSVKNSQIGNRQIAVNKDGSATVVLYPQSATSSQISQIDAVVKANGWNILRSGIQTAVAPNLLVIREKGQNANWKNALSTNAVTAGAPCPQSANPSLPLPQDPPSAQVTQFNGMGLSAPQGQNCSIAGFLSGDCLAQFQQQLGKTSAKWSSGSANAPPQAKP